MIIDEDAYIAHYGILRKSGRFPWGSGGSQETRNKTFLSMVDDLKKQGFSESEICKAYGIGTKDKEGNFKPSTGQLRAAKTIAKAQVKQAQIAQATKLHDKGLSNDAIAQKMGLAGESSVRALLAPGAADRALILTSTANMLKKEVDEHKIIDIGSGVETHLGVADTRLSAAVAMLKEQGYEVHSLPVPQLGTNHDTRMKVLTPPGTTWGDARKMQDQVRVPSAVSEDHGRSFAKPQPPIAISPRRVSVKYKEDGGDKADGVIYIREGVPDVSIGNARYAQVRVKVGDGHYLKGMAMYKSDLPAGVDIEFNTNKSKHDQKIKSDLDAMKSIKDSEELPFGSVTRQITKNGKVVSAMNLVGVKDGSGEEGSWGQWSRNISAQALSKQSPQLARTQLDKTFNTRKAEYDRIMALTNPVVKKKLLEKFAEGTDSAAVHLKAAAIERQNWRVILPINTLKPNEIYAPGYRDGERVALIRYPHGGTFEIPELTVNNRHKDSKKLLGEAADAVGIHHTVAQRLSGADFDGDTVLVIPNNSGKIKVSPALDGLKNFDPQRLYKLPDGEKFKGNKQQLMGDASNLITDMTIKQASHDKIARAVKHSMVVIDAEKHDLDYKRSYADHGIAQLKQEFQGGANRGASTLISKAGGRIDVPDRKLRSQKDGGPVNRETGALVYVPTGATRVTAGGKEVDRTVRSKKLAETDDAHTLSSGTPMEKIYADHSNKLKSLANQSRLSALNTPPLKYSPSAKRHYSEEVSSLNAKLALAKRNAPLERQAQVIAGSQMKLMRQANPDMSTATRKNTEARLLQEARDRMGAGKDRIEFTQKEWDAIQAGAISHSKLEQILDNANIDQVRVLATPRSAKTMTPALTARAESMLARGATRSEVADALGVSVSSIDAATSKIEETDDE